MEIDPLFWIIGRISEDPRVKAMLNSITTAYHDSMFAGFYKFVIEQNSPLRMKEFPVAMCHEVSTGTFTTEVLRGKILETIWKLEVNGCVSMKIELEGAWTRTWLK